jgi:hypothetical protein
MNAPTKFSATDENQGFEGAGIEQKRPLRVKWGIEAIMVLTRGVFMLYFGLFDKVDLMS